MAAKPDSRHSVSRSARRQSVSLNTYVNATLAAAVAQDATLAFFDDRLKGVDLRQVVNEVVRRETEGLSPRSRREIAGECGHSSRSRNTEVGLKTPSQQDRTPLTGCHTLHRRVMALMRKTQPGAEPSPDEIANAIRGKR